MVITDVTFYLSVRAMTPVLLAEYFSCFASGKTNVIESTIGDHRSVHQVVEYNPNTMFRLALDLLYLKCACCHVGEYCKCYFHVCMMYNVC